MFGMSVKFEDRTARVKQAAEKADFRNLGHAAARIMKDARASIVTSDEPSAPGSPPHTKAQRGHNLRSAIRFDATKEDAVIGPMFSFVGLAGEAHEKGTEFRGQDFPERQYMLPALQQNLSRFAREWQGTYGS